MPKLNVSEYCEKCECFDPELLPMMAYSDGALVTDNEVVCIYRRQCRHVEKYYEQKLEQLRKENAGC